MFRPQTLAAPALIGLALLGLSGCANPQADNALAAQSLLIGMPRQTLLSCAGVPDRQTAVDNQEFYTYGSHQIVGYPGPYAGAYGGRGGWGWGWGGPLYPDDMRSYDCEATFTLRNGRVERIVYGGASGGTGSLSQCYAIVRNCLALVPPQPMGGVPGGPQVR